MTIVDWENLAFILSFFLYLAATISYLVYLFKIQTRSGETATLLAYCGLTLHSAAILLRFIEAGRAPLSNQFEFASVFAWGIVLAYLIFERILGFRYRSCGAFVMPVSLVISGYALFLPSEIRPLIPALQSGWLVVHVGIAILAYSAFTLAFGLAVIYLIRDKVEYQQRRSFLLARIPELHLLDRLSKSAVSFGFFMQSLLIITGAIWAEQAWGRFWGWDPKETWSLVTWLIYAVYIHSRFTRGWKGRKAAWLAIIGFACVLFTYLGVNILLPGLHSYR